MVVGESRAELLNWLNSTLDLNYTKIEQCGSGAAFCQLMDTIVGDVPLNKVRYNAKTEYEFRHNYKILQHVFVKNNITKTIDVEKLIRCKLQDNLELLQWIKRYATTNNVPMKTTVVKLSPARPGAIANTSSVAPKIRDGRRTTTPVGSRKSSGANGVANGRNPLTPKGRSTINQGTVISPTAALNNNNGNGRPSPNGMGNGASNGMTNGSTHHNNVAGEPVQSASPGTGVVTTSVLAEEFAIDAQQMESERNFYFNKLRAIEILIQHAKEMEGLSPDLMQFAAEVEKIMYEEYVEEEEEF
ncbi:Protein BIM1 [Candida viswanathii]|uniref:Protein BIM1 n=1 Tax=Candida viswanathii TaxID=5486 RepID=A0A367XQY3_9ASCO|nr:Protein BIM1 [Candida viswanathii]